ncbi:MAG: EAL domain-containing protein [Magnetococcales bacterium]|nr:EAL domain-containing protein [Magnetococcales bacterium]NGZ27182.1 EAL domain-containing protein [Magnetococcales bacterium]
MNKKPLILIAEDEAVTRLMLERFLKRQGYDLLVVENGEELLQVVKKQMPDVVLLDARMPVVDGFTACSRFKAMAEARFTPVLMITGLEDDQSVDRAFEAGAADFIRKPVHWAILRNRVGYLLKMAQAERALHLAGNVFDNINDGILVTDIGGTIQSVNPAFTRITGYQANEAMGKTPNMLKSGRHDGDFYRRMWAALQDSGSWQGEIWNRRKNGELYPQWSNITAIKNPDGKTSHYVLVFSDLTTVKESEENLLYLSGHDILTDLPNRLLFSEKLNQVIVESTSMEDKLVAVLVMDLDRFKNINDTLGHDRGDQILKDAASRLSRCLSGGGTLARLGGDEFGIILPRLAAPRDAALLATAMLEAMNTPFMVDEVAFYLGGSIGISVYPLDGENVKDLLKNADSAMYHAKEKGRSNYQFYRDELNASSLARILLENNLRTALDNDEFLLYYQPKVSLATGRVVGAEALMRWRHPQRGMVSPAEFIPLAEDTGLIKPMGQWALRSACQQAQRWRQQGFPSLRIAVNLSGLQFNQPDFIGMVAQTLQETGYDANLLELELTESIAMGDVDETLHKLNALARMGLSLAIDDFGTGFSSLSYLKRFPIHTLKIDQSFVRNCNNDPDDAAIIRTIIGLAHSLNLAVVAEGVETIDQLEFLRSRQCDEIQGYVYSRPLPPQEFMDLLEDNRFSMGWLE